MNLCRDDQIGRLYNFGSKFTILTNTTNFVKSSTFSSPYESVMLYYAEYVPRSTNTVHLGRFEVSECSSMLQ